MYTAIKSGDLITWTPWSPMDTGINFQDFMAFINEKTEIEVDDAFIKGEVIYFDELSTVVVEVKEMTQDMFPFTMFANEVESRFTGIEMKSNNPYQRYLCLDTKSMTSLFYYDVETGCLADAAYDAEGNFVDYDIEEEDMGDGEEPMIPEGITPEQITIRLGQEEIEELESKDALLDIEERNRFVEDENGNLFLNKPDACSIERARTWFNTRDCAILSAWRQGKVRKENDDNNRMLQQRLRELGYGVTKVTGWYPEENREMARENSFLTVNLNDEESFRDNVSELSELYDQECFLYKKSGYDTPAVYVYTKDVDDYQKGDIKLLGRLRIGNMDADAYSQIKAGRITFE